MSKDANIQYHLFNYHKSRTVYIYIYILYNVCVSSNSVSPYKVISLYLSYFRGCELPKRLIDQALKGSEVNNSATLGLQDDGPRSNGGEMWG